MINFAALFQNIGVNLANFAVKTGKKTRKSRFSNYLIAITVVLLFITLWAKFQSIDFDRHHLYAIKLRQVQELDARINQNILQARDGLLNYYDPIVNDLAELKKIQTELEQTPRFIDRSGRDQLKQLLQTHINVWQEKERLIQKFQSKNAILKNSLTYFPIAIADLIKKETTDPSLELLLNTLLRNVLLVNLTNDQELIAQIDRQIQLITTKSNNNLDRANLNIAIAHAKIVVNQHFQVNSLVKNLMLLPTSQPSEELIQTYDLYYQKALHTNNFYRFCFYILSLILLIATATLIILRLRAYALATQQAEEKYRHIFENSVAGIFQTTPDGRYLSANPTLAQIYGYDSPEELIANITNIEQQLYVLPERRGEFMQLIKSRREVKDFEYQVYRKDGSKIWVSENARSVWDNNGQLLYHEGTLTDITEQQAALYERTLAEAALKKARKAAEVANRAKSQFLSNMSHELRTPLNAILGFAQLMARSPSLDRQQQGYLDIIGRSGEHLLALIDDVLTISKIEAGRVILHENSFNLHNLLDWLKQMLYLKAESKKIKLIFELAEDLPKYIRTDESKLRQVLVNLLANAIKFTQQGKVILRVRSIHHADANTPPRLLFFIEDTGVGIAAEELKNLFEPFVQTESGRNSQEGTGLGLPISRKFVQLMGGEMTVKSKLGEGTIFKFEIQTSPPEAIELQQQQPHRRVVGLEAGQPDYRILIVEDKPENCQLMVDLLCSIGLQVQTAANGQEAIDLWQSWQPQLIWMDLRMPVMDGYQATRQIKSRSSQTPIIIALTGSAFEEERVTALTKGFDDFVRKPFRVEEIFAKMSEHLGIRYCYDSVVLSNHCREDGKLMPQQSLLELDELKKLISTMPVDWRKQLHQAAIRVDSEEILQLIEQIPYSNTLLTDSLINLVNNFYFDEIISLTENNY